MNIVYCSWLPEEHMLTTLAQANLHTNTVTTNSDRCKRCNTQTLERK